MNHHDLGKTSTIIACAKKMYGPHYSSMCLELNASDDRGIDVVRDQIKEFAGTKKLFRLRQPNLKYPPSNFFGDITNLLLSCLILALA